ncbi:MAG: hypothetical protein LUD22_01505 [Coprobacillus sp.]|nr:hypothetical protein [Coprobacillus sp.]
MTHLYSTKNKYFAVSKVKKTSKSKKALNIDVSKLDQKILGFGGAITNAVLYNYNLLDEAQKKTFLDLIYAETGLNYKYARIPIGTCDFNKNDYTYAKKVDLSDFNIHPYEDDLIGFIKRVEKEYHPLTLMGSIWSPLPIYKSNQNKVGGRLLPQYYQNHAQYISKYLKSMKESGIDFSFLSINNEPEAKVPWESCLYKVDEEAHFAQILYNVLKQNGQHVDLAIYDHNRDDLYTWVDKSFTKYNTYNLFNYVTFHWYDDIQFENVKKVHDKYPKKTLVFSEGCIEGLSKTPKKKYEDALRYFNSYITDLNSGTSIFLDWNILLDTDGGPNHVGNFCEAPLMYDKDNNNIVINPSYYAIKHISSFIGSDCQRVVLDVFSLKKLNIATFYNSKKKCIIILILNLGNSRFLKVKVSNKFYLIKLRSHSMNTVTLEI